MPFLTIAFFLAIALVVVFGAQFFLYFSIVRFFSIIDTTNRLSVYVSTAFMPVSFFAASILASIKENAFTRRYYLFSGFLLGIMAHLFLASVAAWVVSWIFEFLNFPVSLPALAEGFFFIGILVSLYGIWNATHAIVKRIEVTIPNLPEAWKGKRIVQLSDIHLGYIYRTKFMQRICAQVNALHPDMVVITGDLFDGMDGNLEQPVSFLDDIHTKEGIFFVTGNHETYFGVERAIALLSETNVRVLRDEVVDVKGLKVIGLSYPEKREKKNVVGVLNALGPLWKGSPNVLLFHSPIHTKKFKKSGIHLQLSGHTHRGQIFPFNYFTKLVYRGHDYGIFQDGDYTLYTTSGVGTWGPAMRLGNRPEIVEISLQ